MYGNATDAEISGSEYEKRTISGEKKYFTALYCEIISILTQKVIAG